MIIVQKPIIAIQKPIILFYQEPNFFIKKPIIIIQKQINVRIQLFVIQNRSVIMRLRNIDLDPIIGTE